MYGTHLRLLSIAGLLAFGLPQTLAAEAYDPWPGLVQDIFNNRAMNDGSDVIGIEDGWARVDVKNHFAVGDRIEVMHPSGNRDITLSRLLADNGSDIQVAPGSGHIVRIQLEAGLDGALLSRYL